jgi:hypothetical protein
MLSEAARPAHGTGVSRTEDIDISTQMLASAKPLCFNNLHFTPGPVFVALPLPLESALHDTGSSMKHLAILVAGFAFSAATLHAQSSTNNVPESHRPPPGMCRIWIDGVPPAHQPAPTDCATAIRKRPLNARVVFGNDATGNERNSTPAQQRQSNFSSPNAPSREEQERAAQQQREAQQREAQERDAQERQRAEAQRQREEQEKRAANHAPPSPPPRTQERAAPPSRPRSEKPQRPPHASFSSRRPG